jgi:hypothetical protein
MDERSSSLGSVDTDESANVGDGGVAMPFGTCNFVSAAGFGASCVSSIVESFNLIESRFSFGLAGVPFVVGMTGEVVVSTAGVIAPDAIRLDVFEVWLEARPFAACA